MGIEDLQDLRRDADRVLVIVSDEELSAKITNTLEKRAYEPTSVGSIRDAGIEAKVKLFDVIVFECTEKTKSPDRYLSELLEHSFLGRSPILLLHPDQSSHTLGERFGSSSSYQIINLPLSPSDLIVALSKQLRLRKIQGEQASFQARLAKKNAELRDLTNRFKAELQEAQSIQKSLHPTEFPNDKRISLAARYIPLEAVGGDLYDFWEIEPGKYGLMVGDVTGHGLPAAFVGAMTKMALSYARKSKGAAPNEMLAEMNSALVEHMPEGRFVTIACVIIDAELGSMQVGRGGHPPIYIWRKSTQSVEVAEPKGMPVGVLDLAQYEHFDTTLQSGDRVLLVSDGIIEACNLSGEMIGIQGVSDFFNSTASLPKIGEVLDSILQQQEEFCEGRIIKDDNTLLGLEWMA